MKSLNNKGSTLVMLLVIMGVLAMLGTVILSVTITNYKMKIVQSKDKKNLYFAESGIDEAYGKIGQVVDEGIISGNNTAVNFMESIDFDLEIANYELGIESPYVNEDGTINYAVLEAEQNQVFKDEYKKYIIQNIKNYIDKLNDIDEFGEGKRVISSKFDSDKFLLSLSSIYEKGEMKRGISAEYEIIIPDYNKPYYIKSNVVNIPQNIVWAKAISVDGDLLLNNGELTVNGNIYIKGKEKGIALFDESERLEFNGEVITTKDLLIDSSENKEKSVNLTGNLFAKNLLISSNTLNSSVNIDGSLFTSDDLELNGKKSKINITNGYYGISDGSKSSVPDKSSSIIINSPDLGLEEGSNINISGDILLYGTSYINTLREKYQTGESVSIKGNYKTYSYPLTNPSDENYKEDNITFMYYNPLVLAHSFANTGEKLDINDKKQYFIDYEEQYRDLNLGQGIKVNSNPNRIISTGVVLSDGNIINSVSSYTTDESIINFIVEKVNQFNNTVSEMSSVSNQVDFSKINSCLINLDGELLLFNSDDNKKYAVVDDNINEQEKSEIHNKGYEIIEVKKNKPIRTIIISKGDILLYGDISLIGTVISNGSLLCGGIGQKSIDYNHTYVSRTIAKNKEQIEDIFINNSSNYLSIETEAFIGDDDSFDSTIISDKLIKMKNWRINKSVY